MAGAVGAPPAPIVAIVAPMGKLSPIWACGLHVRVLRQMKEMSADSGLFGQDFLWVLLAQKVA